MGRQDNSKRKNNDSKKRNNHASAVPSKPINNRIEARLAAKPTNYKHLVILFVASFTAVLILGLFLLVIYPTQVRVQQLEQQATELHQQQLEQKTKKYSVDDPVRMTSEIDPITGNPILDVDTLPGSVQYNAERETLTFHINNGDVLGYPFKSCYVNEVDYVAIPGKSNRGYLKSINLDSRDIVVLDPFESNDYEAGRGQFREQFLWEICGVFLQQNSNITSITWLQLPTHESADPRFHRNRIYSLLQGLNTSNLITMPLAALVTVSPDATNMILEWITAKSQVHDMIGVLTKQVARRWVPLYLANAITPERQKIFQLIPPQWPVLLLHGQEDPTGTQVAKLLQAQAPQATTRVEIPFGHVRFWEQEHPRGARLFGKHLLDFLHEEHNNNDKTETSMKQLPGEL